MGEAAEIYRTTLHDPDGQVRSLEMQRAMGDRYGVAESLTGLARSAAESGNLAEAARLLAAAEALLEALGAVLPRRLAASFETSGQLVRGDLDQGELDAAQEAGTALASDELATLSTWSRIG